MKDVDYSNIHDGIQEDITNFFRYKIVYLAGHFTKEHELISTDIDEAEEMFYQTVGRQYKIYEIKYAGEYL